MYKTCNKCIIQEDLCIVNAKFEGSFDRGALFSLNIVSLLSSLVVALSSCLNNATVLHLKMPGYDAYLPSNTRSFPVSSTRARRLLPSYLCTFVSITASSVLTQNPT